MVEKNYDPDNENCPEKETVENLYKSKLNSENTQTVEEFIDDNPNRIPKDKTKDKTKDLEDKK
ncbi:hypothetical protein [Flavobacterium piscis]|uniref:Uncharacterized protein n=1 Tax=Flavobacterium piscis TaxID=1114874 RepID=A0ABU1YD79_9FLAO|nr:hypothetical protein [Flavobacterium piscis]MDR7211570.1 hypothetical protein [Flavobacterium piscis]